MPARDRRRGLVLMAAVGVALGGTDVAGQIPVPSNQITAPTLTPLVPPPTFTVTWPAQTVVAARGGTRLPLSATDGGRTVQYSISAGTYTPLFKLVSGPTGQVVGVELLGSAAPLPAQIPLTVSAKGASALPATMTTTVLPAAPAADSVVLSVTQPVVEEPVRATVVLNGVPAGVRVQIDEDKVLFDGLNATVTESNCTFVKQPDSMRAAATSSASGTAVLTVRGVGRAPLDVADLVRCRCVIRLVCDATVLNDHEVTVRLKRLVLSGR